MPFQLHAQKHPGAALQQCLIGEVRGAIACLGTNSTGAVHEARKHLKKARSALRLLRGVKPRANRRAALTALGKISRHLSSQRDQQVIAGILKRWRKSAGDPARRAAAANLLRHLKQSAPAPSPREVRREAMAELRSVAARLEAWSLDEVLWEQLGRNLRRSHRRVRKSEREFQASQRLADLHEWRKRSKDLWHQLRLLKPLLREPLRKLTVPLRELTELQGQANDLDVMRFRLARKETKLTALDRSALRGLLKKDLTQLLPRIRDAAEAVRKRAPKDFARAMRTT
jgi:CHAD domain-containing protein